MVDVDGSCLMVDSAQVGSLSMGAETDVHPCKSFSSVMAH